MIRNYLWASIILLQFNSAFTYGQTTYSEVLHSSIGCTANAIVPAYDNGFILVGEASGNGLVAKIDSAGNVVWEKTIGENVRWSGITRTADTAYFLVGSGNNGEAYVMKIDTSGNLIWHRTLTTNIGLSILSAQQTFDHGYIITGFKNEIASPNTNVFVSKLDSLGNTQWSEFLIGGNNANKGKVVRQMPDSTYVVAGYVEDFPPYDPGAFLVKLGSTGNIIFAKKYALANPQTFLTVQDFTISNSRLILLCDDGVSNTYILETNLDGELLSSRMSYDFGIGQEADGNLKSSADGSLYFVHGSCWGSAIVKLDSQLQLVFGKSISLAVIGVLQSTDNGFLIAGYGPMCGVRLNDNLGSQIGIIKTDSLGNAPSCVYADITDSMINSVLDSSTITFTSTAGVTSVPQMNTVELFASEGCVEQLGGIEEQTIQDGLIVFPNPLITSSSISFSLEENAEVIMQLFDMTGKTKTHIDENFEAGDHMVKLNRDQLSSGIYFLQVKVGKGTSTMKVVIQ